jgi:hypothetical protein
MSQPTYLESKATYSRLLSGGGTLLTDSSGALDVHCAFKTHYTSSVFASAAIANGGSSTTTTIDFGAFGGYPDQFLLYVTNSASESTTVTPSTSYDGITWVDHTKGSASALSTFAVSAQSLVSGFDRYLRFTIANEGSGPSNYTATSAYYA